MRADFQHDGRLIGYRDVQPSGGRQAGAVLFLHAFPLAADMWEPQLKSTPGGWRFVAMDMRGFGRSSPDAGPLDLAAAGALSVDDYARDALSLLDHLGVREAVICGLSMGGYVAFAIYRLARQRVRGLVLADTRPDADSPEARAGRDRLIAAATRDGSGAVADAMMPRLLGKTSRAERHALVERVSALARAQPADSLGAALVRLKSRPDSTPLLPTISCPVLVVVGDEDEVTPPDTARQMHGQIADAALAVIGGAGHLSNLEQPDEFNEALSRFLAQRFIQP